MSDPWLRPEARTHYEVRVLVSPALEETGVTHVEDGNPVRLDWGDVHAALAAEVGEPQGVRTVVFDLVRRDGDRFRAYRLDAEPGEEAIQLARRLEARLPEAAASSLKSIAVDGVPSRWYPDLGSFEVDALAELEASGVRG